MGKGFVSYNQAARFTEDLTPIPVWEGLWLPSSDIKGIHYFTHVEDHPSATSFGFLCSTKEDELMFGFFDPSEPEDSLRCKDRPIEWSFETSQFAQGGYDQTKSLKDGRFEIYANETSRGVRVYARSNVDLEWRLWKEHDLSEIKTHSHVPITLGKHPSLGEGTWFQVKVEGLGYCEVDYLAVDHSTAKTKAGESPTQVVETSTENIFKTTQTPASDRWPNT